MNKELIGNIFDNYCSFIKEIELFISENFGSGDFLEMKNNGVIPSENYKIKGYAVKGYSFHGFGCNFKFKNAKVDIEFKNEVIGFTAWSFYLFSNKISKNISESLIDTFLFSKVIEKEIIDMDGIFILPPSSLGNDK